MKTLNKKHAFVLDYWFENHCQNKAEAMRKAGYSQSTVNQNPGLVFNRPDVIAEIERRRSKLTQKHELKLEWVVSRLMDIANTGETLAKFIFVTDDGKLDWNFDGATSDELKLINDILVETTVGKTGITRKTKIGTTASDRKGALDSLARILGAFNDNMTIKGELSMVERLQAGRARVKRENDLKHLK